MLFEPIGQSDLKEITEMVKKEFPYTGFSQKKFEEKLADENIELFKLSGKEGLVGFIEMEWLSGLAGSARVNAVVVKKEFRGKGFGGKILSQGLKYLEEQGADPIILLVEKDNLIGKKLYQSAGFEFLREHHKKIGGKEVEEMILSKTG